MSNTSPIQHLIQQRLLLELEYATEKETFRLQTESLGLERKIKRGDAWWPLRIGRNYYNSLNQLCIEVHRLQDDDIEHNFEYGKPVIFFTNNNGQLSYPSFGVRNGSYSVSYVDGDRMVIALPDNIRVTDLQNTADLGIQLFFDETSYKTMFDALDRVIHAKGNRLGYLRDLFYSRRQPERFSFRPMTFPYLNKTQEEAVNNVLTAKDVMIVHGPPGTGKTTTLVEAIYETLMRENQVLVCAQSNMAVDWISEKLVDRGVNVLRIGNPSRVNDKMLSFTNDRRF